MGFSGASAGFGLGLGAGTALLAADTPVLGGGDKLDVKALLAGGGGLEVVLRLALERAREALSISLVDTDVEGLGEVGVVALKPDLGEVGVVVLQSDLGEVGLALELDFGGRGLTLTVGLTLGLGEVGWSFEEDMLTEVDRTASLTELTTCAPVVTPPTLPMYL